jgi:hypothetical protein
MHIDPVQWTIGVLFSLPFTLALAGMAMGWIGQKLADRGAPHWLACAIAIPTGLAALAGQYWIIANLA